MKEKIFKQIATKLGHEINEKLKKVNGFQF